MGDFFSRIIGVAAWMVAAGVAAATVSEMEIPTGNIDYKLLVAFQQEKDGRHVVGLGLRGSCDGRNYSKRGWGNIGFLNLSVDGKPLSAHPAEIKPTPRGCEIEFAEGNARSVLAFSAEAGGDKVFVTFKPAKGSGNIVTAFVAYPGDYNKGKMDLNHRMVSTAKRTIAYPAETTLSGDEPWLYFHDAKNNPAGNPGLANCALLYNPREASGAEVKSIDNYSISARIAHREGLASAHYVLWNFPGMDSNKGLEHMRGMELEFIE